MTQHQPKGGMCVTCKYRDRDCSFLNFESMPILEKSSKNTEIIVRCTKYRRRQNEP